MADPKYANLPGIAYDQPDLYETSDLPEADQDPSNEDTSTSVEILHLSANETFGKFKGKHLSSDKVDFSDRLRPSDKKKGYISWSGDFELAARGETETPLQKYQRLNCEVRELVEELEEAKKAKETNEGELAKVAMRVSGLQEELVSLKLEEVLGSEAIKSMQDPGSATAEKLLAHLERLKLGSSSSKDGSKNSQAETKKTEAAAKLDAKEITAKFDKRLEALEKALGANPEAMSSLAMETSQKSVAGAISVLSARTSLLEPSILDHVEGRLAALQSKMNSIAERKQVIEDQDKARKINDLYEQVQRIQAMSNVLPSLVDRLDALQELHDQALQFSKTMAHLESVQQKLGTSLANNESLLKEVQGQFSKNIESIQQNFQNVEDRMAKIKK